MFEILIPYRDDPAQWYPVDAVSQGGDIYRIVSVPEAAPALRFGPGDRVECEQQTTDGGHVRLLARRMAQPALPR